jgi:hypothetical protein
MSLSVLKNRSRTCPIVQLYWKDSMKLAIFVQIVSYLTTNEIKYVLYDGIIF